MHMAYNTSDRKYPHEARYYEPENEKTIPSCDGSGQNVPKSDGGNDVRGLLGAGGWVGSPAEIARFVCAIDGLGGTDDILKPSSVQQMTKKCTGTVADRLDKHVRPGQLDAFRLVCRDIGDGKRQKTVRHGCSSPIPAHGPVQNSRKR